MPYIGKEPEHGNYQLLDALTAPSGVFDGSRTVFNLTADGVAVYPTSPTTMIISLGGVLQEPNSSYTVSGNQITFTTAPATSTTFFGVSLGDTLDIGTPSDGSVTVAKMAANSVDSDQYVDGSIDSAHIGNDQIDSQHYAAQSIDNEHLADDAVGADELAANAVVNASVASGAAIEFSKMADLTASRALVSDGNGDVSVSAVTSTEIGYLDGVTSAIQTQLNAAGGAVTREGGSTDGTGGEYANGSYTYDAGVEATTTSTSAVDLIGVASLTIAAAKLFHIGFDGRKTSGAAAAVYAGLKENSTVVFEAADNSVLRLPGDDEAMTAFVSSDIGARVTNYIDGLITGGYNAKQNDNVNASTSSGPSANQTASHVTAEITSLILRGITVNQSNTFGLDEFHVYSLAVS